MTFLRYASLILLLFVCMSQGFAQNQPRQQANRLDFETWEKINVQINSRQKVQRMWAIRQCLRYRSERTINLVKERLLSETDSEVADLILTILEGRKSRKDFFYVLDYLKITSDENLSLRSMRLLYDIHPPRLHYEINQLMKKDYGKVFFLTFLKAIKAYSNQDLIFLRKAYLKQKVGDFMVRLPVRRDKEILKYVPTLIPETMLAKKPSAATIYWYIRYQYEIKKGGTTFLGLVKLDHIEALPASRQQSFLSILLKLNSRLIDPKILVFSKSMAARRLVAHIYLNKAKYGARIAAQQQAYTQAFERMLNREQSRYWLLPVSQYYDAFSQNEKDIWRKRCRDKSITSSLCFKVALQHEPVAAVALWQKSSEETKKAISQINMQAMLKQSAFIKAGLLDWALNHQREFIRLKVIIHLSKAQLVQHKALIIGHWLAENDRTIRSILLARAHADKELYQLYEPHIYELYLTRKPDLPEIVVEKKETQPEAKTEKKTQTSTPQINTNPKQVQGQTQGKNSTTGQKQSGQQKTNSQPESAKKKAQ